MARTSNKPWLNAWSGGARRLAHKTERPMVCVVIDETRDGTFAHTVLGANYGAIEFAAKALLGDIIAGITSDGYTPGECESCDERLARAQAAFALLEPQSAQHLSGPTETPLAWGGGKREVH